jgi:hypothetical protein
MPKYVNVVRSYLKLTETYRLYKTFIPSTLKVTLFMRATSLCS